MISKIKIDVKCANEDCKKYNSGFCTKESVITKWKCAKCDKTFDTEKQASKHEESHICICEKKLKEKILSKSYIGNGVYIITKINFNSKKILVEELMYSSDCSYSRTDLIGEYQIYNCPFCGKKLIERE